MALLVFLFAIPALLWSVLLVRWGSVIAAAAGVLIAGTLFGPPFFHLDGPFQISAERVLWALMLVYFAIHWRMGWTDPKGLTRGEWVLIAFVAFTAISSQMGLAPPDGSNPLARWVFYIAMPAGMYGVARNASIGPSDLRMLSNVLVGLGVYLGATAVLEISGLHGLVFPRYIVDPDIWEFYGRGRGPLLNPSANGVVMTITLGAALTRWIDAGRVGKVILGLAILIILAGCYATLTRCVWMGAAGLLGFVALLHMSRATRIWALAAVLLVGGSAGFLFKDELLLLKRDKDLSAEASLKSVELRPLLAIIALEMFKERPLVGFGYGHYLAHNEPFTEIRDWQQPLPTAREYIQHNVLLSILVDCGLLGLSLYVGLLAWWTANGWKLYRSASGHPESRRLGMVMLATVIAYLTSGMFQDVTVMAMVHMYLMFIAGLASGLVAAPLRTGQSPASAAPRDATASTGYFSGAPNFASGGP